jgi:hypothetical protein
MNQKSIWREVAEDNQWPDPVLLKNMTPERMPGFPYSRGGFRNKCTGKNADRELSEKSFFVGKLACIRRADLVYWLDSRTKGRAQ